MVTTKRHQRTSPFERLLKRGALSQQEKQAGEEIMFARFGIDAPTSDLDLPAGAVANPGGADSAAARRMDVLRTYHRWGDELRRTDPEAVVKAVLFDEMSFTRVDAHMGWREGKARQYFVAGLRHFAALRGNAPRGESWRYTQERN